MSHSVLYMFRRGRAGKMHKVATLCRVSEFGKSISCDPGLYSVQRSNPLNATELAKGANIRHFTRLQPWIELSIILDRTEKKQSKQFGICKR